MTEETPRERFMATVNAKRAKGRKNRRKTLKSIVVENLDDIVRFHDEDNIDYAEIADDLAEAYGRSINERSFRTTISALRNKGTASKPKGNVGRAAPLLAPSSLPPGPSTKSSSSVETIRDDDPDL